MLRITDFIRDYMRRDAGHPMIVHCSAGIGRTGMILSVVIGIDLMLRQGKADLTEIVKNMRKDRGGMMQTFEQYEFAYK